jgi:uncharacterized membrane protein
VNRRHSIRSLSGAREQRGAIIVMAALALSLVVILLSVADIGFLYYYKREYQKAADLAAMAGAKRLVSETTGIRSCDGNALPAAQANATQNLGSKNYALTVLCGKWNPSGTTPETRFDTGVDADQLDAVRAVISGTPPRFLPYVTVVTLTARATALADQPLAQLRIRSTLATVDSTKSPLLNSVVGGLLGGSINLPVAAWNGLLNTDINLLKYLDALALELGVNVGNYDQVLGADVTLRQLMDVAADVLNRGGGTGDVSAAVGGLGQLLGANLPGFSPLLKLGDLLNIKTGTPASALDLGLNVFNLVEGSVQLASAHCAVCVDLPINLPGLAGVGVKLKVIEPPQLSAIGNPNTDHIAVRTAQVRVVVSANLPALNLVNNLLAAVTNLLGPVTNVLNSLLSLNLGATLNAVFDLLGSLICGGASCPTHDIVYVKVLQDAKLDLSLDVGSARAEIDAFSCSTGDEKSMDVAATAAVGQLRLGKIDSPFALDPVVNPVEILQIGQQTVRPDGCLLTGCWGSKYKKGNQWVANREDADFLVKLGIRVRANNSNLLGGTNQTLVFHAPVDAELPDIKGPRNPDDPQIYKSLSAQNLVGSLKGTLGTIDLELYKTSNSGGLLELLVGVLNPVLKTLVNDLLAPLVGALGGLLDPILEALLGALGINLASAEVGANLSCDGGGATLID